MCPETIIKRSQCKETVAKIRYYGKFRQSDVNSLTEDVTVATRHPFLH